MTDDVAVTRLAIALVERVTARRVQPWPDPDDLRPIVTIPAHPDYL